VKSTARAWQVVYQAKNLNQQSLINANQNPTRQNLSLEMMTLWIKSEWFGAKPAIQILEVR
jgi:hypothetical protein